MNDKIPPKLRTERALSAGGVVYRREPEGIQVVICGRSSDGVWGLPKGGPDSGESLQEAAVREVEEETGLKVSIEKKITVINYWFARPQEGVRFHKFVHHFLMTPTGEGTMEAHDWEFDRVEWVPIEEACRRLTYPNEIEVVRKAQTLIQATPK